MTNINQVVRSDHFSNLLLASYDNHHFSTHRIKGQNGSSRANRVLLFSIHNPMRDARDGTMQNPPERGTPHLNYNWRRKPSNVTSFRGCHLRTSTSVLRSRTAKGYDTVGAKLNRTRECHDLAQCYVPMRKRTHAQV